MIQKRVQFRPQTWGITTRLVLTATVPPFFLSLVISSALYVAGMNEASEAVRDRGRLIAAALAEMSEYGVVSGNTSYLSRNIRHVLKTDNSIASIEILDSKRLQLVEAATPLASASHFFERPVGDEIPDIDAFDLSTTPHVPFGNEGATQFRKRPPAGFVRVSMSDAPMLKERRQRLLIGVAFVLLATLGSGLTGLFFAQRLRSPLSAVMTALREIRQGNFDVRPALHASGELGELQGAIAEMARGLAVTHQELENRVASRTQELERAIGKVSESDAEKRRLIARSNAQLEEERKRIAVEIHDHLNASLIVLRMKAQHIAHIASSQPNQKDTEEIHRTALAIEKTTDSLYVTGRNLVKQLRPEVIDTLGLRGALEEMIRNYDSMHPGCTFQLRCSEDFPNLRGDIAITAFRLVQEALSNVVKHANATTASVALDAEPKQSGVLITITDDGIGFEAEVRHQGSLGLIGMRERVTALGGSMAIFSTPSNGTTITIHLPC